MKKVFLFIVVACMIIVSFTGCDSSPEEKETEAPPIEIILNDIVFQDTKYYDVYRTFEKNGFTNISTRPLDDLSSAQKEKDDVVEYITIDGKQDFKNGDRFMSNVEVLIYYHNIDMLFAPFSSDELSKDELFENVKQQFEKAGFTNVSCVPIDDLILGFITKDGQIENVSINGVTEFKDFDMFPFDAEVIIEYHTFATEDEDQTTPSKDTEDEETSIEKDNVLTIDNNEDLKKLLALKDECDPFIQEFFDKYKGKTIEFDGNIVYMSKHEDYNTRFDIMIGSGDYQKDSQQGPNFKFEDVNANDLDIETLFLENVLSVGVNVHVIAVVDDYNSNNTLFLLEPISVIVK